MKINANDLTRHYVPCFGSLQWLYEIDEKSRDARLGPSYEYFIILLLTLKYLFKGSVFPSEFLVLVFLLEWRQLACPSVFHKNEEDFLFK